jgi:hypothetical protein
VLNRDAVEAMASGEAAGGGSMISFSGGNGFAREGLRFWNWLSITMRWAAGSFLFCRREAWEGAGGFDERVYAGEELWFSRRVRKWGKPRGLGFRILTSAPPFTSSRRINGPKAISLCLLQLFVILACPLLSRSRRACFLWYRR